MQWKIQSVLFQEWKGIYLRPAHSSISVNYGNQYDMPEGLCIFMLHTI